MVNQINENRVMLLGGGFVLNSWAQNQMASGAFEIRLNGQLIFSKLDTGRLPTAQEISAAMAAHGVFADEKFGDTDL
jgi:selT/selW/selH-like putative selenoprotein